MTNGCRALTTPNSGTAFSVPNHLEDYRPGEPRSSALMNYLLSTQSVARQAFCYSSLR